MFGKAIVRGLLRNIVLFVALTAYTLPAQAVDIEFVTVRDPGNVGELSGAGAGGYGVDRICGAVDHAFQISKYETTTFQYMSFLNAVAKADPYGLWRSEISSYPSDPQRRLRNKPNRNIGEL